MALEEGEADDARERFLEMRAEVDAELQSQFAAWDATHERNTLNDNSRAAEPP